MQDHDEEAPGLGTETGANEAGGQNPDHTPGATPEGEPVGDGPEPDSGDAPDNPVGDKNPDADDSTTQVDVPQEGGMEDDPDRASDAT